jgi:hypothetical protein
MLQVLPFRGIGPGFFPSLSVCYLENVWPGGEIGAYIKGKLLKDSLAPRTPYAILFPDRSRAKIVYEALGKREEVKVISHSFEELKDDQLLEPSPAIWMTPIEIIKAVKFERRLVLDTYHIRRKPKHSELEKRPDGIVGSDSMLGDWHESIIKFLPYTALVHIQPSQDFDELNRFLQRQDTEFEEMLKIIKQYGYDGDFIVETCLKLKGFNLFHLQKTMKNLLVRIKEVLTK